MNKIDIILVSFTFIAVIGAILFAILYRNRTKNTINRINGMLDCAISGTFSESVYDESSLSSMESKLSRFLSMSICSENNIKEEKDRIKALISDISHQTKTPISNILLYSQLLKEQKQLSSDSMEMINQIIVQSEKLDFLVQALVKTSRLETGLISVVPNSQSVLNLITTIFEKAKSKAEEKEIEILIKCEDSLAFFDKKWTEEALYNILDNAIKYTPNGGSIKIAVTPYEMFCRIDVIDDGIGIREQDINSIFNRFYRSIDVNQYEGVGIGLYLAREIINAQGGYIKVSSAIGKGSTFSIFLPT